MKKEKRVTKVEQDYEVIIRANVKTIAIVEKEGSVGYPEMGWIEFLEAIKRGEIDFEIKKVGF